MYLLCVPVSLKINGFGHGYPQGSEDLLRQWTGVIVQMGDHGIQRSHLSNKTAPCFLRCFTPSPHICLRILKQPGVRGSSRPCGCRVRLKCRSPDPKNRVFRHTAMGERPSPTGPRIRGGRGALAHALCPHLTH